MAYRFTEQTYLNPEYALQSGAVSFKEMRAEYSRLRTIENKRVQRLQASPKFAGTRSAKAAKLFPEVKTLTDEQLARELTKVYSRVEKGASSARKLSSKRNTFRENLQKAGMDKNRMRTADQMKQIENVFNKLNEVYKSNYSIYSVVNTYQQAYKNAKGKAAEKEAAAVKAIEEAFLG